MSSSAKVSGLGVKVSSSPRSWLSSSWEFVDLVLPEI